MPDQKPGTFLKLVEMLYFICYIFVIQKAIQGNKPKMAFSCKLQEQEPETRDRFKRDYIETKKRLESDGAIADDRLLGR